MKIASNHNSLVVQNTIHKMNGPCTEELKVGNIRNSLEFRRRHQKNLLKAAEKNKKLLNIGLYGGTALRICQF